MWLLSQHSPGLTPAHCGRRIRTGSDELRLTCSGRSREVVMRPLSSLFICAVVGLAGCDAPMPSALPAPQRRYQPGAVLPGVRRR
jgi:hypothetical protein